MPEFHRRAWKITVRAKISHLYVKFKATAKRPSGKFQGFLKLDKFIIGVGVGGDSESESQIIVQQRRTVKSRMLSFVKKHFGRRRSGKVAEIESGSGSWHFGGLELSCVAAAFGVGLGCVLGELMSKTTPTLMKRNNVGISSFIMVCLVLCIHRCKFLWAR